MPHDNASIVLVSCSSDPIRSFFSLGEYYRSTFRGLLHLCIELPHQTQAMSRHGAAPQSWARATHILHVWRQGQRHMAHKRGHWLEEENRRRFLLEFAQANGVREAKGWRNVTYEHICQAGGKRVLEIHGSVANALRDLGLVNSGEQEAIFRPQRRRGHWDSAEKKREFVEDVVLRLGLPLERRREWKGITAKKVADMGGSALLRQYGSVLALLRDLYPEEEWDKSAVSPYISRGHWDAEDNRRAFIERAKAHFDVKQTSDWSRVTKEDFLTLRGAGTLLARYGSFTQLLIDELGLGGTDADERILRPLVSPTYWSDESNVKRFLLEAEFKLGLQSKEDWYRVSREQIVQLRGATLLESMSLPDALALAFPTVKWESSRWEGRAKKSKQRFLYAQLGTIFDGSRGHLTATTEPASAPSLTEVNAPRSSSTLSSAPV